MWAGLALAASNRVAGGKQRVGGYLPSSNANWPPTDSKTAHAHISPQRPMKPIVKSMYAQRVNSRSIRAIS